jgi:hypothetical protein
MRIAMAWVLTLLTTSVVRAAEVDWKAYGFPSFDGPNICFYDAQGVVRAAERHVRVWTKCLLQKDLDSLDPTSIAGRNIVESVARKIKAGYIPPIAVIHNLDFNQVIGIASYEETADTAELPLKAQFFYEINCAERMIRTLSVFIKAETGSGSDNKPSEWAYIPPEGSGANLQKLLCLSQ